MLRLKMPSIYYNTTNIKRAAATVLAFVVCLYLWNVYSTEPKPVVPERPTLRFPNDQVPDHETFVQLMDQVNNDTLPGGDEIEHFDEEIIVPKINKLPKLYQSTGTLTFKKGQFILDGKPFRIISGAIHYFRVVREYWKDRLMKMKACGLNTIETYVPWNLHEEYPGQFNFDGMLDLRSFLMLAHELGFYVIFRPGPYICSEWDFGGLPGWLLKDPNMRVRSNYPGYKEAVTKYFAKLIPLVTDLQHKNGGPIIAVQVENEFGSYSSEVEHLKFIKDLLVKFGISELLLTSDGWTQPQKKGKVGVLGINTAPFFDEALPTVNFKEYRLGRPMMQSLKDLSADLPIMVTEFWPGWFDHWNQPHAVLKSSAEDMAANLQSILKDGASVNFYMFHGGTNFAFMAGANWFNFTTYKPDVTSYDYIAPLSEAGDATAKYHLARKLISKYGKQPDGAVTVSTLPEIPPDLEKKAYGAVHIDHYLSLQDLLSFIKPVSSQTVVPMEMLELHNGYGQNFGYTLYRTFFSQGKTLKFTSPPTDRIQVIINGIEIKVLDWTSKWLEVQIPAKKLGGENILDILVENCGRVNYVKQGFNVFNEERKGLKREVLLDGRPINVWKIYPFEFNKDFIEKAWKFHQWKPFANNVQPAMLYKGVLKISGKPADTFVKLDRWNKGIVIINGFNLGRYWNVGPQLTLYVPAPILKTGDNQVLIFEHHKAGTEITFLDKPILDAEPRTLKNTYE